MTQFDVNYLKKMGLNNPYSKDYIQIIHMDFLSTIDALAETHVANKLAFTLWKRKAEFTENAAFTNVYPWVANGKSDVLGVFSHR